MADVKLSTEVDSSGVKAGLNEIRDHVKSVGEEVKSNLASMFAAGAIVEFGRRLLEASEHLEHLSEKFGISTTVLQEWGNAAQLVGISSESVAGGLNKLEIARSKALGGNEGLANSFLKLGISIEELRTASPDEILRKLGSSSLDAADLVKILGRSALELRPLLEGVANGSIQLGNAMSESTVKALADANRTFKELSQTIIIFSGGVLGGATKGWQAFVSAVTSGLFVIERVAHGDIAGARAQAKGGADLVRDIFQPGDAPARKPNLNAGGDAGESDDFGNPTGGGGGSAGSASARRVAELEREQYLEKLSREEKLAALEQERIDRQEEVNRLRESESSTQDDIDEATVKVLETEKEISKTQAEIDKQTEKYRDDIQKAREGWDKIFERVNEIAKEQEKKNAEERQRRSAEDAASREADAADFNRRSGISGQQQDDLRRRGYSEQEIAAMGGRGTGIAQIGSDVNYTDVALGLSIDPRTGQVDQRRLAQERAQAEINSLNGRGTVGWQDLYRANANFTAAGSLQVARANAQQESDRLARLAQLQYQLSYPNLAGSGIFPVGPLSGPSAGTDVTALLRQIVDQQKLTNQKLTPKPGDF